ncbi:hypothetical protein ARMGADRAFT_1015876 [Armillaria gallica]|uniref:Uncharacterized protein n=1 Tax=Armillaria gallica TaxID=47427 RepID=A0A2H3DKH0_ARMGA|nr:hypothetical protein ARMGADRAFT_1015876 [Armillaria gallica]
MTVDDLLGWADRYDTEREGHWFERLDATRTENLHGLPWKIKGHMRISLSDIGRKSIPTGHLGWLSPGNQCDTRSVRLRQRRNANLWFPESVRCLNGIVRSQFNRPVEFQSARLWCR